MTRSALVFVLLGASIARAAPPTQHEMAELLRQGDDEDESTFIKFGFYSRGVAPAAKQWTEANQDILDLADLTAPTIAVSADGTAAWVGGVLRRGWQCYGLMGTFKQCPEAKPRATTLMLVEKSGKRWLPVAVHSASALTDKEVDALVAKGATLAPLAREIDPSAEEPAKLFEASIADPKALAASVSKRADVVLFGSGPGEKTVGGAKVAAALLRWKLELRVADGVVANTTSSKQTAWVAANVVASGRSYRALALYDREKSGWHLVGLELSFVNPNAEDKHQMDGAR